MKVFYEIVKVLKGFYIYLLKLISVNKFELFRNSIIFSDNVLFFYNIYGLKSFKFFVLWIEGSVLFKVFNIIFFLFSY